MEDEELEIGLAKRRRRGKAAVKSLADLQAEWAWLADMKMQDQPWLFFALHKAYDAQVLHHPSAHHPFLQLFTELPAPAPEELLLHASAWRSCRCTGAWGEVPLQNFPLQERPAGPQMTGTLPAFPCL